MGGNSNEMVQRGLGAAQIVGGAVASYYGSPELGVPMMMNGIKSEAHPNPNQGTMSSIMGAIPSGGSMMGGMGGGSSAGGMGGLSGMMGGGGSAGSAGQGQNPMAMISEMAPMMQGMMGGGQPPQSAPPPQPPMPMRPAQINVNQPAPQTMGTQVPMPQPNGPQMDPRLRQLMSMMGGSQ